MKFSDLLTDEFANKYGDVDVYNNVYDEDGVAFCTDIDGNAIKLTEHGKQYYEPLMNLNIEEHSTRMSFGDYTHFTVDIDCDNYVALHKLLMDFLWSAAGYCDIDKYDSLFIDYLDE